MAYFKTFLMTSRITDDFWALEIRFAQAETPEGITKLYIGLEKFMNWDTEMNNMSEKPDGGADLSIPSN